MSDLLLERTAELAAINRAIRVARAGCGRHVVICGPPGSGRIDDLHWGDADSLEWLGFVARRLRRTGLAVIAAAQDAVLTNAIVLRPQPLSERAVAALLHVERGAADGGLVLRAPGRALHRTRPTRNPGGAPTYPRLSQLSWRTPPRASPRRRSRRPSCA